MLVLLILIIMLPISVSARAGGGGGSGGSGGGGGGGSSTSHGSTGSSSRNRSYRNNRSDNPVSDIISYVIFGIAATGGAIIFYARIRMKNIKVKNEMKKLSEIDSTWNYKEFRQTIEDTFFAVQKAWMERNQDISRCFISKALYEEYNTKCEWMKLRHEKNILKRIHLSDALPVEIDDEEGDKDDMIWVYIRAKMVDYIIDDRTKKFISGSILASSFEEYWKFIKENGTWVLDEIRQKEENES